MANQHIKGITVEIGGDTSELSQALKGVDKDAKKISDELKSVNAALKVDPSNVVALTQKTELLAQSIEQAKKKVDILKKAEADAQKQLERGEIGADQFRALQREVVFAEGKLKKLEKQLDDTKKAASQEGDAVEKSGKDAKDAAKDNEKLSKSLDDLKSDYDDAKSSAAQAGAEFGATLAGAAAVGTALAGVATAGKEAVMQAMSYADALRTIQMRTGASEDAMRSYEMAMKAVFDSGLGEDLDDVASTMAIIARQTKQTDPDKLETMAKNALVLRESFGYETQEQLRTVDMLVKQFHIDEAQAFNLIAEASQKGLNKNGDLLDIINEYAVHYKNLGYNQDEFFNSLANGAGTGVFSVNNLGNAMKEFSIKTKDEATSTTEAYELLGLNADEMRAKFAQGGQAAKDAAKEVNEALFSMNDEVKQNTVGVGLYGTMWEDLGKDAISAMTNAKGEISATGDAMERVRDIKLDATSTKWSKLGRTVQTELLLPIGEKLLPYVEKFFNFCIENSEELIPLVKTLGVAFGTIFVVNKAAKFASSLKTLTSTFKSLTGATVATGGSTALFSGLLGKGTVAAAAFALTLGPTIAKTEAASKAYREGISKLKDLSASYREAGDAAKDSAQRQQDAYNKVEFDYEKYEDLAGELQELVDANGRVKDGAEERVKYIKEELADAAGIEIEIVNGVVQEYNSLAQSMTDALTVRKTYDMLTSMKSDYAAAKAALSGDENVVGSQMAYEAAKYRYNQLYSIAYDPNLTWAERNEAMKQYGMSEKEWSEGGGRHAALFAMQEAQRAYEYNLTTVGRYDALSQAYYSQDTGRMQSAADAIANPQYLAGEYSYAFLRDLQVQAQKNYENMLTWSKQEGSSITAEQLAQAAEELRFATEQATIQWEAEGRPDYSEEGQADPSFIPYAHWSMQGAARQTTGLLAQGFLAAADSQSKNTSWQLPGRNALQGFIDATAENHIPYDLTTPAAETAKQNNELLGQILRKIDELDLQIVLDDGTVAGRVDQHIGKDAADQKRGALK